MLRIRVHFIRPPVSLGRYADHTLPGWPEMRDELSPDEEAAAIEALGAEVQRQAARVGVDWEVAAAELRALVDWDSAATELRELAAETATTVDNNDEMALGLDLTTLVATLRSLPDHSGTAAFIAEFKRRAT